MPSELKLKPTKDVLLRYLLRRLLIIGIYVVGLSSAQSVRYKNYDYSPFKPIFDNNGKDTGVLPTSSKAQDRSIVAPYDINPYFGFRKYGEMRYEPLPMSYLSNNGGLFDGLLGSYGAAKSGTASPDEQQQQEQQQGSGGRSGRTFNPVQAYLQATGNNNRNSFFSLPFSPSSIFSGQFPFGQ